MGSAVLDSGRLSSLLWERVANGEKVRKGSFSVYLFSAGSLLVAKCLELLQFNLEARG